MPVEVLTRSLLQFMHQPQNLWIWTRCCCAYKEVWGHCFPKFDMEYRLHMHAFVKICKMCSLNVEWRSSSSAFFFFFSKIKISVYDHKTITTPPSVTRLECFIKKGRWRLTNSKVRGEEYWLRGANMKVWFSLMNRSVIMADHHKCPSSKGPSNLPFLKKKKNKQNNGHLQFICWKLHLVAVFSCPSVYLSFTPEASDSWQMDK